jgi:drug/metabolite transporter (DMT)-like permease
MLTAVAFTSMALPAGIYLLTTDLFSIPLSNPVNLQSFISIFILSSVNSALAIYLFSKLTKMSSALFASFCTYLMPFVAIFWGVLDGEEFYSIHFIGMAIIFLGIYLANRDSFKAMREKK